MEDWHTLRPSRFGITQNTERDNLSVIGYSFVGSNPTAMILYASMAQFGRASACHVEGCGFKSRLTLQRSSWSEEGAESYLKTRGYSILDTCSNLYFLVYREFESHFASQNNFANRLVGKATKTVSGI